MKLHRHLVHSVVQTLNGIFFEGFYADKTIEKVLRSNPKWGARDRRFFAESVYDIVRWRRFLWRLLEREESPKDLYLLFGAWWVTNEKDLPEWDEFQALSSDRVNQLKKSSALTRAEKHSIPDWLDHVGFNNFSTQWDDILEELNRKARVVLRTNTLKTTRSELQALLEKEGVETQSIEGTLEALVLKERKNVFITNSFKKGLFEVQDASSQMVAHFLGVKPGDRVIDACAGAGGKSLHIAALMKNKGKVISLDIEAWKLEELKKRSRRAGADIIEPRVIDSTKVIKRLYDSADKVLLDVPCTGIGVLKRNPDTKWKISLERMNELLKIQAEILGSYSKMLKSGGILVYSTCSILKQENSEQVSKFITENPSFELIEERLVLPSDQGFDGFYMAKMKRKAL